MDDEALAAIAQRLYGLRPEEFTRARDAEVSRPRRTATAPPPRPSPALRRPSLAAWLVNALVRERAAEIEQLLGLGEALASAQRGLAGDEVRALGRQRQQLLAAVGRQARALARELGTRSATTSARRSSRPWARRWSTRPWPRPSVRGGSRRPRATRGSGWARRRPRRAATSPRCRAARRRRPPRRRPASPLGSRVPTPAGSRTRSVNDGTTRHDAAPRRTRAPRGGAAGRRAGRGARGGARGARGADGGARDLARRAGTARRRRARRGGRPPPHRRPARAAAPGRGRPRGRHPRGAHPPA